jgi:hypothetical protein
VLRVARFTIGGATHAGGAPHSLTDRRLTPTRGARGSPWSRRAAWPPPCTDELDATASEPGMRRPPAKSTPRIRRASEKQGTHLHGVVEGLRTRLLQLRCNLV